MTKEQLLAYIVQQSAANVSDQQPTGFCYLAAGTENLATELHNEELIQAAVANRAADGSYPVRPTDAGMKWVKANSLQSSTAAFTPPAPQTGTAPAPAPAVQSGTAGTALRIEAGIPVPEKKAFGRTAATGETLVDKYPFGTLGVNESFFVPQDNPPKRDGDGDEIPKHRSFSSVVSQANKKLHPRNFVIREWTEANGTVGARVWRVADMEGERPVRARKKRASETDTASQAGAANGQFGGQAFQPQPGAGAPFAGAAPMPPMQPGAFPAPQGGFPAPDGGFPAPQPGFASPGAPGAFPGPGAMPPLPAWGE